MDTNELRSVMPENVHNENVAKGIGNRMETRVLAEEPVEVFITESERVVLKNELAKTGISWEAVNDARNRDDRKRERDVAEGKEPKQRYIRLQVVALVDAVGEDGVKRMIEDFVPWMLEQPSGAVMKPKKDVLGDTEQTNLTSDEVIGFMNVLVDKCQQEGFKLDSDKLSKGKTIPWRENTVYRFEALMETAYRMLGVCSIEEGQEDQARDYQTDHMDICQQRLIKGALRTGRQLNEDKYTHLENRESSKIVRHLPVGSWGKVLESLTK